VFDLEFVTLLMLRDSGFVCIALFSISNVSRFSFHCVCLRRFDEFNLKFLSMWVGEERKFLIMETRYFFVRFLKNLQVLKCGLL